MTGETESMPTGGLILFRLATGLAQGVALYLLYSAFDAKVWPATDGHIFAPLSLLALFVPLIAIQGAGNLRLRTLIAWTILAAVVVAALAWYDIWRGWPVDYVWESGKYVAAPRVLPSAGLFFFLTAGLFIAHALISGGDADREFMASYPTHFDVAWKLGVQVALSVAFVGAFWLILWLGAALFQLIKLEFFEKLIEHRWFAIPASALAVACALHVSDVRAGLVRGVRTLVLVLLSWLLPLMALIAAGFMASLIFTGLAPLWATRHATALLLTAAAVLVVLINAAYQDGHAERKATLFFELAIRLASLLLVPTVALAAYALWLRVAQYGWTVDRISSAACVLVAACYAVGYASGATLAGTNLIERWNFATALLILAVLVALFTPLADPARISVASQMARLKSGAVKLDAFDFNYLRWEGARYGHDALVALSSPKAARNIREQAQAALDSTARYTSPTVPTVPVNVASRLTVHPKGRTIPASFLATKWDADPSSGQQPACVNSSNSRCDLFFADMDGDGRDDIVLLSDDEAIVYRDAGAGVWRIAGTFGVPYQCSKTIRAALLDGDFKLVEPPWHLKDVDVLGARLRTSTATMQFEPSPACPK